MQNDNQILSNLEASLGIQIKRFTNHVDFNTCGFKEDDRGSVVDLYLNGLDGPTLEEFPRSIVELHALKTLYLANTEIEALPPDFGRLCHLNRFHLSSKTLTAFPAEVLALADHLRCLELSSDELRALPPDIGQLRGLTELDINSKVLPRLPSEIGQLARLSTLSLSCGALAEFPREIANLAQLRKINFHNHEIESLPSRMFQIPTLEWLNIGAGKLRQLPLEIGALTELKHLDIMYSRFRRLPREIGKLRKLTHLSIEFTRLESLPAEIGNLTKLVEMSLSNNRLHDLPTEIGKLERLKYLYLRGNQLNRLPRSIVGLRQLEELDLWENPLDHPPERIAARGVDAVFGYLSAMQGTAPQPGEVFISYTSSDRDRAVDIYDFLQVEGLSVWFDRKITPGDAFDAAIAAALDAAKVVIVLWSRDSVESHWVREEAHLALARGILVPVFLDDVDPPVGFRTIQGVKVAAAPISKQGDTAKALLRSILLVVDRPAADTD